MHVYLYLYLYLAPQLAAAPAILKAVTFKNYGQHKYWKAVRSIALSIWVMEQSSNQQVIKLHINFKVKYLS